MPDGRCVLITGIAGELALLTAAALEQRDDVARIVGVDSTAPASDALRRTEFVQADLGDPVVGRIIEASAVDTIVHMSMAPTTGGATATAQGTEQHLVGANQLLSACQSATTVRRLVLRSSTAVYGSGCADPALFRESAVPATVPEHGFGKGVSQVEARVREFGMRRRDVDVSVLRFANVVGPRVQGAVQTLFTLPLIPRLLGFDPRLQFCHEQDAVAVLTQVATAAHPGIVNVAGGGTLYLSQCIRLAGRSSLSVPVPLVRRIASFVQHGTEQDDVSTGQLPFLQYGRVVDTTRLRTEVGYLPRYSSREAFEAGIAHRRVEGPLARARSDPGGAAA